MEFTAYAGVPPSTLTGIKMAHGLVDEEDNPMTCVLLSLIDCPPELAIRTVTIYTDVSSSCIEFVMTQGDQLRHEQGRDTLKFCIREDLANRDAIVRASARKTVPLLKYTAIKQKIDEIQRERIAKEAENLAAGSGGSGDVHVPVPAPAPPRGLRAASISVAVAPVFAKAGKRPWPKSKASSPAVGGAGSGMNPSSARSSASMAGNFVSPAKKRGSVAGSVLQFSFDGTGGAEDSEEVDAEGAASSSMQITLKSVYPTLNINAVLRGLNLGRSLNGVRGSRFHKHFVIGDRVLCVCSLLFTTCRNIEIARTR
jgi:hypothetical protein